MRKPRIKIVLTKSARYPVVFQVRWPGNHWKNSQWHTFDEALVAAGVKRG